MSDIQEVTTQRVQRKECEQILCEWTVDVIHGAAKCFPRFCSSLVAAGETEKILQIVPLIGNNNKRWCAETTLIRQIHSLWINSVC